MSGQAHRYETRLDVLCKALDRYRRSANWSRLQFPWYNQTLCGSTIPSSGSAVVQGEYHWHKHDNDDEVFVRVGRQFLIDPRTGP